MAKTFAVSGQHYLFAVQAFAHTILALGGDEYDYALRDRETTEAIDDVRFGKSELAVLMKTSKNSDEMDGILNAFGLEFVTLTESDPMVALPASHPLSDAESVDLEELSDWPYLCFEQDTPELIFAEEALSEVPRSKRITCTDRASLSELASAVNGYTVTSGILVGITDSGSLATVPLRTDVKLRLGYVRRKDVELSPIAQRFVANLEKCLKRYAS